MLLGFAQILIFLSFPTQDSERLPAVASQQIAETSFQRKTSFIRPTRKPTKCFALCITEDKRFAVALPNFSILIWDFYDNYLNYLSLN